MIEEDRSSSGDLVSVGHAYGVMEAAVAFSLLNAAGIFVHVQTWNAARTVWNYTTAFGGMAILVPSAQAAEASEILAEFRPHSRRWPLVFVVLGALTILMFGVTLPASGFYAARRPAIVRAEPI